jgi:protein LSM14
MPPHLQGFQGGPAPGMWNPYHYPPGPGGPDPNAGPNAGPNGVPNAGPNAAPNAGSNAVPNAVGQGPTPTPGADNDKGVASALPPAAAPTEPRQTSAGPQPPADAQPPTPKAAPEAKTAAAAAAADPQPESSKAPQVGAGTFAPPPSFSLDQTAAKPVEAAPQAAPPTDSIIDATESAKAAVAVAMSQLQGSSTGVDNLTRRVNDMRINAHASRGQPFRGGGRARGPKYHPRGKIEIPDSDFDFDQANAKFNKEEAFKEAGPAEEAEDVPAAEDAESAQGQAYNKKRSFFDNIGSEARDRAENGGHKPGGREWRSVEEQRNIETFGEGRADGYRPRRGRGGPRGRGYHARGGRGRSNYQGQQNES